ncbi:FAD/NAD(P)-binding protein [Sulfidibacter corallicola]|uniref:FAD/NAD(P)-binding protein n=1 Tax=Sulfidibacter corallicola TaxID=2818388 RepID=A0A8A4TJJ6_SULCO|nr:FAD/NAD(P)-binding domain-containing protein [Sulfidibacter corallicola]QTD48968.1 FAD/NAD(P)-binding protein [Sulfidibacter corallicola]
MTAPSHIALVGCGFTGTSAFFQLVDGYPVEEITIFEASGEFGPGYPYRLDDCPDYLINNTTDTMCLVPSNTRAFVTWLKGKPELAPDFDERGHLPRSVFGRFLKDVFESTGTVAAIKGIRVNLVPHEVIDMDEDPQGRVTLHWNGGRTTVDKAILTTGRCPDLDRVPPAPAEGATYVASHIRNADLDEVPLDAKVHVLGASLSAYDVVNRLFSPSTGCAFHRDERGTLQFEPGPNQRRVLLCSRSGRLKAMQSRHERDLERTEVTPDRLRRQARAGALDLPTLAEMIRKEADHHGAVIDWDAVRDPYADCSTAAEVDQRAGDLLDEAIADAADPSRLNFLVDFFDDARDDLWQCFGEQLLTAADERTFRNRLETAVLAYAAPCPVPTAEKLLALHRAGRLSFVKGVRAIGTTPTGQYEIEHEHGTETARVLVNTTGSVNLDVVHDDQPALVRNLVRKGLIGAYRREGQPMKGAAVDMRTYRSRDARSIYIASMLLWGPGIFTSSAYTMARVVEQLLAELFSEDS